MHQTRPERSRVTPMTATFNQSLAQGRCHSALGQARLGALGCLLMLGGCDTPGQLNMRLLGRDISGAASEARLPPPGLDRPSPNLASVPPIPERPDPAARLALTTQLQTQRDALNQPLSDRRADSRLSEGAAVGQPPIPAGPPLPAALARAPVIPWTTSAPALPAPRATGAAPDAPAPNAIAPGDVPDLPSADLLAQPPPPRR